MTDGGSAPPDQDGVPAHDDGDTRHPGWVLTATILASSLAFIDGSVINVALPAIGANLKGSAADLQWTLNAFTLPLSALLLIGGAMGDHYGRRLMLIAGTAIFLLASIACALAPGLAVLLAARAGQGIGAAMLMPNSLAILGNAFSGAAKGRAIGTWAAASSAAAAVGPPLGGWLVSAAGWRSIFWINTPVAIGAIALALIFVEERKRKRLPLDWWGAGLATLGLGGITWALTIWSSGQGVRAEAWTAFALGVAAMIGFLWIEHRRRGRAMMPLAMFASAPFVGLTLLTLMLYGAMGGVLLLLPYVLISACGYSPFDAGLALLPLAVILSLSSRTMGHVAAKFGPRWPLTIGPIVAGCGLALFVRLDAQASYWTQVLPAMVVLALGMAGAVAPLTTAVLSSVDDEHTGTASGFNSAVSRGGGLFATALAGAVMVQKGPALIGAFHGAALVGAAAAASAGLAALFTLGRLQPDKD